MAASSSQTSLKTILEMAVHELCTTQERLAEIHSVIYEEIHPRINQALAGLDEALASQQMDMDGNTHQQFLMACKRAHKLQESIKPLSSPFLPQEEETDDKSFTANSEDDFTLVSKAAKAFTKQAAHEACTLEHYSSYVQ